MIHLPDRIYIIGGPGSGKSFLAKRISALKHLPHFELDDIMRFKKYTEKLPMEQRTHKLHQTILQKYDKWVIEWLALDRADECYKKADLVIVFNVPSWVVAWRIFRRYVRNVLRWDFTETFWWMFSLAKRAMTYQNPKSTYSLRRHIEDCKKYKCNYVVINDAKEILS